MSRPYKTTVDYFPHYCSSGKTLFTLQNQYGNDGYAFWFKLLELLGATVGHYYDYNKPSSWRFLLAKTSVSEEVAISIIDTLIDLNAIDRELAANKVIWSQNFIDNLADVYKRRQIALPLRPDSHKELSAWAKSQGWSSVEEYETNEENLKAEGKWMSEEDRIAEDSQLITINGRGGADYFKSMFWIDNLWFEAGWHKGLYHDDKPQGYSELVDAFQEKYNDQYTTEDIDLFVKKFIKAREEEANNY